MFDMGRQKCFPKSGRRESHHGSDRAGGATRRVDGAESGRGLLNIEKEVKDLDRIQHEWDLRLNSDFGGVVQQLEKTAKEVYQLGKPQYLAAVAAREAAREAADADPLAYIFD